MAKAKPKAKAKTAKRPVKFNSKAVHELIKANNYMHQYCDFISMETHRMAFELQKVISHVGYLENRLLDTQKMFTIIVSQLSPASIEKIKKEMNENKINAQKEEPPQVSHDKKIQGFHDSITKKCPICKSIGTIKDEACKECGYTENKK